MCHPLTEANGSEGVCIVSETHEITNRQGTNAHRTWDLSFSMYVIVPFACLTSALTMPQCCIHLTILMNVKYLLKWDTSAKSRSSYAESCIVQTNQERRRSFTCCEPAAKLQRYTLFFVTMAKCIALKNRCWPQPCHVQWESIIRGRSLSCEK